MTKTLSLILQLFESILLEDGDYFLLPEHLERLKDSAEYFGFRFVGTRINADLERIRTEGGAFKVRLTLWKDRRIETRMTRIELLDLFRALTKFLKPYRFLDGSIRMRMCFPTIIDVNPKQIVLFKAATSLRSCGYLLA